MIRLRIRALAAAFTLTIGVTAGSAQTVITRSGPPGSRLEVDFNGTTVGSAVADANGDARVEGTLFARRGDPEKTVQLFLDVCGDVRRVLIVESSPQSSALECRRYAVSGRFGLRPATSFVIDLAGSEPNVRIWQGRAPIEWLRRGPAPVHVRGQAPVGLVLFAGGPALQIANLNVAACGSAPTCNGGGSAMAFTTGTDIWLAPFAAVEARYLKPVASSVTGNGDTYHFTTRTSSQIATVVGKVAVPAGIVRPYGLLGANFHRVVSKTTNTINDTTLVINEHAQTTQGATQDFVLEIRGFGWVFGGGGEVWLTPTLAVYGEVGRVQLKGTDVSGGPGTMDNWGRFELAGLRFRVGPK